MKPFYKIFFLAVALMFISACGTMSSIQNEYSYVPHARVIVTPSLEVSGRLVKEDSASLEILVDGAVVEYNKDKILKYTTYMAPDPLLIQKNILENSNTTANNSGFYVFTTVISVVILTVALIIGAQ